MKKRKRRTPNLIDRFFKKFGPLILKICRFVDKHTHSFFEGFACILTGGAYRPRPYEEPTDLNNKQCKGYHPRQSSVHNLMQDFNLLAGDFHAVQKDISKAVRKMEQNPEVAKAMHEAQNSPEFQKGAQILRDRMAEVQRRCNHIRQVCSYSTTVGSGNTSEQNTRK